MAGYGCTDSITIREVENGFIVNVDGLDYVFTSLKAALKFIEKSYSDDSER